MSPTDKRRVGILISGRGSNMVALLEGMRAGEIPGLATLVVSNKPHAAGLAKARSFDVPALVIDDAAYRGRRDDHDRAVAAALDAAGCEVICLAGYMRILGPWFVEHYLGRLINIHPALLPAFPGLHAQRQALEQGVRVAGCTVHFLDRDVDRGPIIAQAAVPVLPGDTEETLSARILEQEHRIYPLALRLICEGRVRLDGRCVTIDGETIPVPAPLAVPQN